MIQQHCRITALVLGQSLWVGSLGLATSPGRVCLLRWQLQDSQQIQQRRGRWPGDSLLLTETSFGRWEAMTRVWWDGGEKTLSSASECGDAEEAWRSIRAGEHHFSVAHESYTPHEFDSPLFLVESSSSESAHRTFNLSSLRPNSSPKNSLFRDLPYIPQPRWSHLPSIPSVLHPPRLAWD